MGKWLYFQTKSNDKTVYRVERGKNQPRVELHTGGGPGKGEWISSAWTGEEFDIEFIMSKKQITKAEMKRRTSGVPAPATEPGYRYYAAHNDSSNIRRIHPDSDRSELWRHFGQFWGTSVFDREDLTREGGLFKEITEDQMKRRCFR